MEKREFTLTEFIDEINKINYIVDEVTENTKLVDFQFDHLDAVETVMGLEKRIQTAIPDEFLDKWNDPEMTVGMFTDLVVGI